MQVNPSNSFSPVSAGLVGTGQPAAAGGKAGDSGAAPLGESTFTPTADLARLLAKVRELPDVRADRLEQVALKLAEVTTPQAAGEAARALLDSGDLGQ